MSNGEVSMRFGNEMVSFKTEEMQKADVSARVV